MVFSTEKNLISDDVFKILQELRIDARKLNAVSVHGPAALGDLENPSQLLVLFEESHPLKIYKRKGFPKIELILLIGKDELRKDCAEESIGGAAAGSFLLPYRPVLNPDILEKLDVLYKRHVIVEALQNLILEHRLASMRLLIKPEFFLYDKLKRLSIIYPPIKPYIEASFKEPSREALRIPLRGFEKALKQLEAEEMVIEKNGAWSPAEKFVLETLSKSSIYTKFSKDLEHVFKLYLNANLSSPLEPIKDLRLDLRTLKPIKIPEPSQLIEIETSLGPQPLLIDLGIKDFIERVYGVKKDEIRLKKAAGVLNAAYIAEFDLDGRTMELFIKKYLNWTDFKWIVAWLWAIGVKNFSLFASVRMSNEIYFVNKLTELGFNAAEILHVNWPRKTLFQKFINGKNLVAVLTSSTDSEEFEAKSFKVGKLLGELHRKGICMGDCNPFSFIFSPDGKVYLVDLEQCFYDESFAWDLAELLYYTCHYLDTDLVDVFGTSLVEGYLRTGETETVLEALDLKYARIFAPMTPPWIQVKVKDAIMKILKS